MQVTIKSILIEGRPAPMPERGITIEDGSPEEIIARALRLVPLPEEAFAWGVAWTEYPDDAKRVTKAAFGILPKAG